MLDCRPGGSGAAAAGSKLSVQHVSRHAGHAMQAPPGCAAQQGISARPRFKCAGMQGPAGHLVGPAAAALKWGAVGATGISSTSRQACRDAGGATH